MSYRKLGDFGGGAFKKNHSRSHNPTIIFNTLVLSIPSKCFKLKISSYSLYLSHRFSWEVFLKKIYYFTEIFSLYILSTFNQNSHQLWDFQKCQTVKAEQTWHGLGNFCPRWCLQPGHSCTFDVPMNSRSFGKEAP